MEPHKSTCPLSPPVIIKKNRERERTKAILHTIFSMKEEADTTHNCVCKLPKVTGLGQKPHGGNRGEESTALVKGKE